MAQGDTGQALGATNDSQHQQLNARDDSRADQPRRPKPSSPTSLLSASTIVEGWSSEKTDTEVEVAGPSLETGHQGSIRAYPPGYGKVAASLDTDPGFLVFRRFGWLHNYVLLELQDELRQLEQTLELHDEGVYKKGDRKTLKSRRLDILQKDSRHGLIEQIHKKLKEYDELLFRVQKLQSMQRPLPRYQKSVCSSVHNESRMQGVEADWICRSEDLAALTSDAEHNWFNGWIEDLLYKTSKRVLWRIFSNAEQRHRAEGSSRLVLTSPKRLDALIRFILTFAICVFILVPLLLLNMMQTDDPARAQRMANYQIVLIFFATFALAGSCSLFTRAKRHEVIGATAAYCAVLVVFLGNTSNVVVVKNT